MERERKENNNVSSIYENKMLLQGNSVLIPVKFNYEGRKTELTLVLETGSTHIVLHSDVADKLNIKAAGKTKLLTAGGNLIEADIAKLSYAEAGPFKKKIITFIIDYEGVSALNKGLFRNEFSEEY